MAKTMLIDATHAEETRVVVADGTKVDEFDFESLNKRQLAGNIYLAKVTRVEPSLQAAFIDYGGNRHGFLAFSEIHPDYYQIPVADREALLAEERAYAEQQAKEEEEESSKPKRRRRRRRGSETKAEDTGNDAVATGAPSGMDVVELDGEAAEDAAKLAEAVGGDIAGVQGADAGEPVTETAEAEADSNAASEDASTSDDSSDADDETDADADDNGSDDSDDTDDDSSDDDSETVADDDDVEEIRPVRKPRPKKYKIQEVIKVRQIMLVQVVKEERGNKGAALTTYLSLAGRYCVLMPNTARGGGISRKITNAADRKKLKDIATALDVPQGAGLIVRTAGSQRTKTEIKRDYEYLQRQWEQIRELTLKSIAPAPIYQEGDLIHRTIRDLYNRDIDEVIVDGEAGYKHAKNFMKMIMPSHAKKVKQHTGGVPLFAKYKVEGYLSDMFNPTVQLKSGGYIVINITEALVAIDVNSGRSTKEGSIEDTATKTNLEAAEEVARQVRLRDLAGLIVIDFIDMDERRNNNAVEKRIKEKLKSDRARIQVGRISSFGLMEMSRQRLRPGMLEATTQACHHCHGTGLVRSDDSLALSILRLLEEESTRGRSREVLLTAPVGIVNFLINFKRDYLDSIEARSGMAIRIEADASLVVPDFKIEKFKTATRKITAVAPVVSMDAGLMDDIDEDVPEEADQVEDAVEVTEDEQPKKKRRRRRGGRGRRRNSDENGENNGENGENNGDNGNGDNTAEQKAADAEAKSSDEAASDTNAEASSDDEEQPKKRRRSRRGGRGRKSAENGDTDNGVNGEASGGDADKPAETAAEAPTDAAASDAPSDAVEAAAPVTEPLPDPSADTPAVQPIDESEPQPMAPAAAAPAEPEPEPEPEVAAEPEMAEAVAEAEAPTPEAAPEPAAEQSQDAPAKPKRRGWWSRG
ncbi:Rne/Rng family ribonuclease [Gymnodinialimonas ceratoperidinii]|uniref:Ribonuclease E n=1 Tax=Gymnodinialimonas ceratoperidinii TaxID=2856823 RepID=A0A8F6TTR9_9RHOB|nr:ribonuclease E/G [Gymnodinialimonas ceratoperidinii]QXT38555.1 ribonuclease E/G [Gymnodinialimonas ceratoperidinii]